MLEAREATDGNMTRRMRFAYWLTKTKDAHSEYVIFIAFPLQQWLRDRASLLRYTYIACLVIYSRLIMNFKFRNMTHLIHVNIVL
jgi:hypothetical protein